MTHVPLEGPASDDQASALVAFMAFLSGPEAGVFILSGAAGTGKTTLLGKFIDAVSSHQQRSHLAALTGRAATVARLRTGNQATTLHSYLYEFDPRASKVVDGTP